MVLTCKKEPPVGPPPPSGPDTTSHNLSWTQYTFGGAGTAGSSYFNDVAIINDTDIWAVGQVLPLTLRESMIRYSTTLFTGTDQHGGFCG